MLDGGCVLLCAEHEVVWHSATEVCVGGFLLQFGHICWPGVSCAPGELNAPHAPHGHGVWPLLSPIRTPLSYPAKGKRSTEYLTRHRKKCFVIDQERWLLCICNSHRF